MRALVVVNQSATTTSARTHEVLLSALSNDLELRTVETSHRNHAADLAAQARADGVDLVVAVGGDGTINEVVNGLLAGDAPGPRPDLAIVPGGSTNVLARNLGIPENPVEATGLLLDAVRRGRRHPLGLGKLDDRYFTFAAGAGIDADVIRAVEAQRARGRHSSVPLYVDAALRRFFAQPNRRYGPIVVEDERGRTTPGLFVAVISNCSPWTYLGSRPLWANPRAEFGLGLDLFGLTRLGVASTVRHAAQLMTRRGPHGHDVLSLHDQRRMVLTSSEPIPVQLDGDYIGERSRVVLASAPHALHVVF